MRIERATPWLAALAGQGAPPEAQIAGTGLQSTLTAGNVKVRFDADKGRITSGR